jgi:hypothetical protein
MARSSDVAGPRFVARRIESDPIILLAATRDGYPSVLGDAGLPEHRLGGLDDMTATELLDVSAPQLSLAERRRVLREAAGNPLALLELPAVVRQYEGVRWAAGPLPLTERLERAFAARVSELPDLTRLVLLVAALDDRDEISEISEILNTGSVIAARELDLEVAAPAVQARIIDVDLQDVPLPPSADSLGGRSERRRGGPPICARGIGERAGGPARPTGMAPSGSALRRARGDCAGARTGSQPGAHAPVPGIPEARDHLPWRAEHYARAPFPGWRRCR